jgi:hypothetical protein
MLLNELFNQPTKWDYITNDKTIVEAKFFINDMRYTFAARTVDTDTMWEVEFTIGLPDSFGKSGTGHQQQVFATVFDIMKDFIKQHSPEVMVMTAEEPNRMKLYLRMFKVLLPNWRIETDRDAIYAYNPNYNN